MTRRLRPRASRELRRPVLAACVLAALSASGCEPGPGEGVLVLAAASTASVVEELAAEFSAREHVEVTVSAGGTNALAAQVAAGAPADLFLAAHPSWAEDLAARGLVAERCTLCSNALVLAVPSANRSGIARLEDLKTERVQTIGIAAEGVPAGEYAHQALEAEGVLEAVRAKLVRGANVSTVLVWLERGEVDAGIVYQSDVARGAGVQSVATFDPATHAPIAYTWVLLEHGRESPAAQRFFAFVAGPEGRARFSEHGFREAPR